MKEILFYNSTIGRHINFEDLIGEIVAYVNEEPKSDYRITVGTDSPGIDNPFFVTAITVLRVGNGGRYFWTKSDRIQCHGLQDRIYKEAVRSITLTQELKSGLKDKLWDNKITVHIDIGRNGSTKDFVEGVVGMVKGYGLEAVIKPDAFCACAVADRHT